MVDLITGEGLDTANEPVKVHTTLMKGGATTEGQVAFQSAEPWVEKYRGTNLDTIILPDEIRTVVENAIKFNSFGNYILYSGAPGTGKTSLAKAIPLMLGTPSKFLYGKRDNEILAEIEEYKMGKILDGKPRFVIIDEVDKAHVPKEFFKNLQSVIESSQHTLRFILTCNNIHAIPDAVKSRCFPIEFKVMGNDDSQAVREYKSRIWTRLCQIAEAETSAVQGGHYDPQTVAKTVIKCYPDIREMICTLHHCFLMNNGSIVGEPPVISNEDIKTIFDMCTQFKYRELRYFLSYNIPNCNDVYVPLINYCIDHLPEQCLISFGHLAGPAYERSSRQLDPEACLWCFCMDIMGLIQSYNQQQAMIAQQQQQRR